MPHFRIVEGVFSEPDAAPGQQPGEQTLAVTAEAREGAEEMPFGGAEQVTAAPFHLTEQIPYGAGVVILGGRLLRNQDRQEGLAGVAVTASGRL